MSSSQPSGNPAVMDFREMDVLRLFFELNHQKMDSANLQQILLEHQTRQSMPASSFAFSPIFKPKETDASTPEVAPRVAANISQIPAPKVVFQYVPSPRFPTPTSTPEPESCDETAPTSNISDYQVAKKKTKNFHIEDRCDFINLRNEQQRKSLVTPTSSIHESDSDHEVHVDSCMPQLKMSAKSRSWQSLSIYNNLPDIVMTEYDRILRDSHKMKIEVIRELNEEFPVSYDYNPKKSRIRTNYSDPAVADDRTKNNIASRRSRQRKKFMNHVLQYSVDFDDDENRLLQNQEKWLRGIVANLENKIIAHNSTDDEKIFRLRRQCGFE